MQTRASHTDMIKRVFLSFFDGSGQTGRLVLYGTVVLYLLLSFQPLLNSGYYSDDITSTSLRGKLAYENKSLLTHVAEEMKFGVTQLGRFLPCGSLFGSVILYFAYDPHLYKLIIMLLLVADVLLFGYLLQLLFEDRSFSIAAMLLLPLFFQFRLYHDPILSFAGGLQIIILLFVTSLVFLQKYCVTGSRFFLLASLLFYNICLYYYEVSIPLGLVLLVVLAKYERSPKKFVLKAIPIIASICIAVGMNIIARTLLKDPAAAAYGGTTLSFDLAPFVHTFLLQLYAAIPLGYFISNPAHIFSHNLIKLFKTATITDFFAVSFLMVLLSMSLIRLDIRRIQLKNLMAFGSVFFVTPAFLVALSAKYQLEFDWFGGWGIGYVPVYLQYFGAFSLLSCLLLYGARALPYSPLLARTTRVAFVFAAGCIALINLSSNRLVVEKSNIDMYYRRVTLENALIDNLLKDVPENSSILIKDKYAFDPFPAAVFSLRSWGDNYNWRNKYLIFLYANKKVNVVPGIPSTKDNVNRLAGSLADGNFFLLTIHSLKEYPRGFQIKEGFVTLDRIVGTVRTASGEMSREHFLTIPVARYDPIEKPRPFFRKMSRTQILDGKRL